jgi:hypothetical protein
MAAALVRLAHTVVLIAAPHLLQVRFLATRHGTQNDR